MSARFALYGVRDCAMEEVAQIFVGVLGVHFHVRNSSYKGGDYYFHRGVGRFEISIEGNFRDDEGVLSEPEFPQYGVLVYVNHSVPEVEQKLSTLEQIELLRMEDV